MDKVKKIYFPNLTGLRALAVLMVYFHHYNQIISLFGIRGIPINFLNSAGELGVLLFFVLSGFLITYLLLTEESKTKKIDIKKFYLRRVLRIWPLYYLMVVLGFFVFPLLSIPHFSNYIFEKKEFIYFLLLSANYVLFKGIVIPGIAPLWSVCVEEYFYLVWPWVLRFKKFFFIFILIVILYPFLKYYSVLIDFDINILNQFFYLFPLQGMVSGGLAAYIFFNNPKLLNSVFFTKNIQLILISFLILILVFKSVNFPIYTFFYCLFFSYLVVNLALNKLNVIKLEFKILNFVGEISYGIYLFHSAFLFIFIFLFEKYYKETSSFMMLNGKHLIFSILIFILTLFFSKFIFLNFEIKFLKFKEKYMIVKSTNKK